MSPKNGNVLFFGFQKLHNHWAKYRSKMKFEYFYFKKTLKKNLF